MDTCDYVPFWDAQEYSESFEPRLAERQFFCGDVALIPFQAAEALLRASLPSFVSGTKITGQDLGGL